MDLFDNVSSSLKAYFSNHSLFKMLLPLDLVLLVIGLVFLVIDYFTPFSDWGVAWGLGLVLTLTALVLTVANSHWMYAAIGLFAFAAFNFFYFVLDLFVWDEYFNFDELFFAAVLGILGAFALMRGSRAKAVPPPAQ